MPHDRRPEGRDRRKRREQLETPPGDESPSDRPTSTEALSPGQLIA
jgi:hypothetical protein